MKVKIYKYKLEYGITELNIPKYSMVLDVQNQKNNLVIWILLFTEEKILQKRCFLVMETGAPFENHSLLNYIGTVQFHDGEYVNHIFEIDKP